MAVCVCVLAGFPVWNAVTDNAKLMLGGEAEYTELVQKYGEKAVETRQKFLSEAEYGSSATKSSRWPAAFPCII